MHVTLVHVRVKAEHIEDFIAACKLNHEASTREDGNRRFDILHSKDERGYFVLYEAYRDAAAAATHKQTAHYLAWRDTVADWMAEPRQGQGFDGLFPQG